MPTPDLKCVRGGVSALLQLCFAHQLLFGYSIMCVSVCFSVQAVRVVTSNEIPLRLNCAVSPVVDLSRMHEDVLHKRAPPTSLPPDLHT